MEYMHSILEEDHNFLVGLVPAEKDGELEVVKVCKTGGIAEIEIQNEFHVLQNLNVAGIRKAKRLGYFNNRPALFLEFVPGISLAEYLSAKRLDALEALDMAIGIIKVLKHLHEAHIIHKNINPNNIILNDRTATHYLIDFAVSSSHALKVDASIPLQNLEGTLAYISPEQTGRINYTVDFRSDFYSYGVLLYQIFTGTLPCLSTDVVEQVHFHLAQKPRWPSAVNANVPAEISEIIMKLLAKNPGDRYQSCAGIIYDLQNCKTQLLKSGKINSFLLGEADHSSELRINTGIYGREKEVNALLDVFTQASNGKAGLVLVGGYSGIGKTSLVEEIIQPVFMKGGSFVAGKFDQYRRDIPYSAIVQALEKWLDSILAEDEIQLAKWKSIINNALGDHGAVVTNLVPNLVRLLGPQEPVPDLGSDNNRIRFNNAIRNFFSALGLKEAPFVLFLDDMQWADYASLEVLKLLFDKETNLRHFLVICAYRDNEVGPGHPFLHVINEVETAKPVYISLGPLGKKTVAQMLADIFHVQSVDVDKMADLFLKKTQGNPFFIKYFLESLKSEKFLIYSPETGRWQWDLEQIGRLSITENVADLITRSLSKYDQITLEILQVASVIGGEFNLSLLAAILQYPVDKILLHLQDVLQDEVILPSDGWQKSYFTTTYAGLNVPDFRFKFGHDKIRDHVYSGIIGQIKEQIHLKVGRFFFAQTKLEQASDASFVAAGHLNKVVHLLIHAEERMELAQLNLLAGKRAKAGGAYLEALEHFQTGIALLPADSWKHQYELTLDLYSEAAVAGYSGNSFDLLFKFCDEVFRNARQPADKLVAVKSQVYYYDGVLDDKPKVLSIIREALKELNIQIGQNPGQITVLRELIKVRLALSRRSDSDILNLPAVSSPNIQAGMQLMAMALPAAYRGYPLLYTVMVLESLLLSLKNGHNEDSAFNFAVYAVISFVAFGDIKNAQRFHGLSLALQSRFSTTKELPQTSAALYAGVGYLSKPAAEILPEYGKAFQAALENGNNFWAAIHLALRSSCSLWTGVPLHKLWDSVASDELLMAGLDQKNYRLWVRMILQAISCLRGLSDNPAAMSGDWYDDQVDIKENFEDDDTSIFSSYYAMKYLLACLFDQPEAANVQAKHMKKYLPASTSEYPTLMFMFYEAVFQTVHMLEGRNPGGRLSLAKTRLKFFQKLAAACPENFGGKPEMIEACCAWGLRQLGRAEELFVDAAQKLGARGFIHEKGLALELAGKLALQRHLEGTAVYYFNQAIEAYTAWGAVAKVKQLNTKYGSILAKHTGFSNAGKTSIQGASLTQSVDFQSILRASKAMMEEIELDKLLAKLMRIVLENGGATRGLIMLEDKGKWLIEAEAETSNGRIEVQSTLGISPSNSNKLAESIANYVIRTKSFIVLDNATREGQFVNDPYLQTTGISSILCMPLINQGKLSGILYLENNLAKGAFTKQQAEVLNILSAEIAISINNARLYYNLNSINKAYERFVPHQFLSFLNKDSITELQLGDQVQKEMAVMFADIRNFTSLSEKLTPEANFNFLNDYLGKMEPIISKHHGFIDKYIGDEIMALFSTGAEDAVDAAIAMLTQLESYNKTLVQSGINPIQIGIGINAGSLMLGIIGGENRWDGTVISDAVNLASRIEDLTREYSVPLLISEFTFASLENPTKYSIRKIDRLKVKGKSKAVTVYEVFDADPPEVKQLKQHTLQQLAAALKAFKADKYAEALVNFRQLAALNPKDTVVLKYIQRCEKASNN